MQVTLTDRPQDRRVDVVVDGSPFTSYIYPDDIMKPVLFPLRTAAGTIVTRGYPYIPVAEERVDHPHHVGVWFNYGKVNGLDFWNNSTAIPAEKRDHFGVIRHRRITRLESGAGQGVLGVEMEWLTPAGQEILRERTTFIFRAEGQRRRIDRLTNLVATVGPVEMPDDKEGVFGIRVARPLEAPAGNNPDFYTDAAGQPRTEKVVADGGANGVYHSSAGLTGDAVWGTRGDWVELRGTVAGDPVSLVIIDHPENPGYPTCWHARGYGLFAANPLGQKPLSNGKDELNFRIPAGATATFRYRLVVDNSGKTSAADWQREFGEFSKVTC